MSTQKKRPPRRKRTGPPQLSRLLTATFGDPEPSNREPLSGQAEGAIWATREAERELRTKWDLTFVGLPFADEQDQSIRRLTRLSIHDFKTKKATADAAGFESDAIQNIRYPQIEMAYYLGLVAGFQFAHLGIGGAR